MSLDTAARHTHDYNRFHQIIDPIIQAHTNNKIRNPSLRDDAVQRCHLALWERINDHTKPKPGPELLRLIITNTTLNTLRDDTRARRRNGTPIPVDNRLTAEHSYHTIVQVATTTRDTRNNHQHISYDWAGEHDSRGF